MPTVSIHPGSTIFVTGVNGLIGSHVVDQLLKRGYHVRGAVRSVEKNKWLAEYFDENYKDAKFELVEVPDMTVDGCYDDLVQGIDGFIHVASPLGDFGDNEDVKTAIAPGVNSGLSALKACAKISSVKAFVFTSSSVAVTFSKPNIEFSVDEKTYNEEVLRKDLNEEPARRNWFMYAILKTETEKAMWKWMDENQAGFMLNSILPDSNFGRLLCPKEQGIPSTIEWGYAAWTGRGMKQIAQTIGPRWFISPVDTALLHISALIHGDVKSERLFGYAERWTYNRMLRVYRKLYPEQKFPEDIEDIGEDRMNVPNQRAEEVLRWVKGKGWDGFEESLAEMSAEWAQQ